MSFSHAAFAPYRDEIAALNFEAGPPPLSALNALAEARSVTNARGEPLRFIAPDTPLPARDYERRILHTGEIPTRPDNWHDAMNALVWLRFPRFKSALNAAHDSAIAAETGALRGRRRDALTMLDESGVWVISENADLLNALKQRAWRELFWAQRDAVITQMRFVIVGHALLEKMLHPYPAITGKCLLLHANSSLEGDFAETQASRELVDIQSPDLLKPLPLLGIPVWDPANAHAAFYDNTAVFRPRTPVE